MAQAQKMPSLMGELVPPSVETTWLSDYLGQIGSQNLFVFCCVIHSTRPYLQVALRSARGCGSVGSLPNEA